MAVTHLESALRMFEGGAPLDSGEQVRLYSALAGADAALSGSARHIRHAIAARRRLARARVLMDRALSIFDGLPAREQAVIARPLAGTLGTLTNATGDPAYRQRIIADLFPISTSDRYTGQGRQEMLAHQAASAAGADEVDAIGRHVLAHLPLLAQVYDPGSHTMRTLRAIQRHPKWHAWRSGLERRLIARMRANVASVPTDAPSDHASTVGLLATSSRPRVEFAPERREIAGQAVLTWLYGFSVLIIATTVMGLTIYRPAPLDHRILIFALTGSLLLFALAVVLFRAFVLAAKSLGHSPGPAFGPDGIEPEAGELILWDRVSRIDTRWRGAARRIRLCVGGNKTIWLDYPRSPRWGRPRSSFQDRLTTLRHWASEYGAQVDGPAPRHRPLGAIVVIFLVAAAVVLPTLQGTLRGATTPWTSNVSSLPSVCTAAGTLHKIKDIPDASIVDTGRRADRVLVHDRIAESQSCRWQIATPETSRGWVDVQVVRWAGTIIRCPSTWATVAMQALRRQVKPNTAMFAVGDEAFIAAQASTLHLIARRANVTVHIELPEELPAATTGPYNQIGARRIAISVIAQLQLA